MKDCFIEFTIFVKAVMLINLRKVPAELWRK